MRPSVRAGATPKPGEITSPASLPTPAELMQRAVGLFSSQAALAARLEVSGSHVSRVLKGTAGLGADACLRLADILGEDRTVVLRACGHAALSSRLFAGAGSNEPHRTREQIIMDRLAGSDRLLVQCLIDRLAGPADEGRQAAAVVDVVASQKGGER